MAACLLMTGFGFWAPEGPTRTGIVATGIYVSHACLVIHYMCLLSIVIYGVLLPGSRSRTLYLFRGGISSVYP